MPADAIGWRVNPGPASMHPEMQSTDSKAPVLKPVRGPRHWRRSRLRPETEEKAGSDPRTYATRVHSRSTGQYTCAPSRAETARPVLASRECVAEGVAPAGLPPASARPVWHRPRNAGAQSRPAAQAAGPDQGRAMTLAIPAAATFLCDSTAEGSVAPPLSAVGQARAPAAARRIATVTHGRGPGRGPRDVREGSAKNAPAGLLPGPNGSILLLSRI